MASEDAYASPSPPSPSPRLAQRVASASERREESTSNPRSSTARNTDASRQSSFEVHRYMSLFKQKAGFFANSSDKAAKAKAFEASPNDNKTRNALKDMFSLSPGKPATWRGQQKFGRAASAARRTSVNLFQAITAMKKGLQVWKLPHRHYLVGKAHLCSLRLSPDERYLYWYSKKHKKEVVVHLNHIIRFHTGIPDELQSWRSSCEVLAFTVHYRAVPISLDRAASSSESTYSDIPPSTSMSVEATDVKHVTFVCKNNMEHAIWTVSLQILLKLIGNSGGGAADVEEPHLDDKASPSRRTRKLHLPSHVMTTEISQLAKSISSAIGDANQIDGVRSRASTLSVLKESIGKIPQDLGLHADLSVIPRTSADVDESQYHPTASTSNTLDLGTATGTSCHDGEDSKTMSGESCSIYGHIIADIWVWGEGMNKVRGMNTAADQLHPMLLHGQKTLDAFQIDCGEHHIVILDEFGSVYTWGFSDEGQLGHGAPVEFLAPSRVRAFEGKVVTQVSCVTNTTCAVTSCGEAYVWGRSLYSFALQPQWYPKLLSTGKHKVSQISCGAYHFAMCTKEGKMLTCGEGKFGALGHGSFESWPDPKVVDALDGLFVAKVCCGIWHTACIVQGEGGRNGKGKRRLYTWGDNASGQLGVAGVLGASPFPVLVKRLQDVDVRLVACGRHHTLALSKDGVAYSWGSNKLGQLGRQVKAKGEDGGTPRPIDDLKTYIVTEVACGMDHCVALSTAGSETFVFAWGGGERGCLGLGDTNVAQRPTQVKGLSGKRVIRVACGAYTSCALVEHMFQVETMERGGDVCNHCGTRVKLQQRQSCARCSAAFCKTCVRQFQLLNPLLPLTSKSAPLKHHPRPPNVCVECDALIKEAQIDAREGGKNKGKVGENSLRNGSRRGSQPHVYAEPHEEVIRRLEAQLMAAQAEIQRLQVQKAHASTTQ